MKYKLDRSAQSVYSLHYHLVIVIKYRRKELYDEAIREGLKQIIWSLTDELGIGILAQEPAEDHLHIQVTATLATNLSNVVNVIKGVTIFPDKITQWNLAENLDACRWLYSRLVQDLNEAKEKGIKLKTYDSQNMIPSMKLENSKQNCVYSKVLPVVYYTLWSNIKGLSASKKNDRKIEGCIKAVIIKGEGERWFAKGLKEKGHNNDMHRSIHDASWSKFIFMLSYKAQSAGRKLIKVDSRNTNQRCSACGSIVMKYQSVRVHKCPYFGFSYDRDYNASRNILFHRDGTARSAYRTKAAASHTVMQVLAMTWEAAPFRTR